MFLLKEIYDNHLTGDIALIIASDDAVDVEKIYIINLQTKVRLFRP